MSSLDLEALGERPGDEQLDLQEGIRELVSFVVGERDRGAADARHNAFFQKMRAKRERMLAEPSEAKLLRRLFEL